MKAKFKAGDILVRAAYKNKKSAFARDEMKVLRIVSDNHPICPQLWYICEDYRGKRCDGLVGVVDECFIKA